MSRSAPASLFRLVALLLSGLGVAPVLAQTTVFDEVHTLAAATTGVPVEHTLNITSAGTYTVTLTDLGAALTPAAPLASVKLAVSGSDALVGSPLVGAGTLTLPNLTPGTYQLHVVGTPGNVAGSGPIGIVVNGPGNAQLDAFADVIALPSKALPNGEAVLDDSFGVSTTGTYTVTLTDLKLPQSLSTLTLLLIAQGSSTPVATLPNGGSYTASVALTAGVTYRLFAVGEAQASVNAGLYTAVVTDGGGAVVRGDAVPVGATTAVGSPTLAAGSDTFTLTDLNYPAALSQVAGVLVLAGQPVAQLTGAGSQNFTAAAGTYQVYAAGTAAASGMGSYVAQVTSQGGGTPLFGVAQGVSGASGVTPYSFAGNIASAGAYTVTDTDFQFPAAFTSLTLAVVQGNAVVGTPLAAAGSDTVTLAPGPVTLVAFAHPSSNEGLFGAELAPQGGGTATLAVTQGVGALFVARQINIVAAGSYVVTASDLGFPANFMDYDTAVTQGTTRLGYIYGGGSFNITATPGTYFLNFIAQPTGSDQAGTYALKVASAPPAPTVTLSTDHSSVSSGSTVDVIWSSTNATSCTASGAWSGAQATSGTKTSAALSANSTFTLACTGPGGTTTKSVSVTVTSSSGGGGSLDPVLLLAVLMALLVALRNGRQENVMELTYKEHPNTSHSGVAAMQNGRGTVLIALLTAALLLGGCGSPASRAKMHMARGREYFSKADYAKADVEFRNVVQILPRDPEARVMAGRAAEALGRPQEAAGYFQSAIDLAPDYVPARLQLGRLFVFSQAPQRALDIVSPALTKHPQDADLLVVRGGARMQLKDTAGALADAEEAVKLAPNDESAVALLASVYRNQDQIPQAVKVVENAISAKPQSLDLHRILLELFKLQNEPAAAEAQLRKLIELAPQDLGFRVQLAQFYVHQHRFDDAQRVQEEAVKALPGSTNAKLALVAYLAEQRSPEEAEKALRGFIAAQPDDEDLRLGLGGLLERRGDKPAALAAYREIIARHSDSAKALIARNRIAAVDLNDGRPQDAQKQLEEVLSRNPGDSQALQLRAQLALSRGDANAAIGDLRHVLRDEPQNVSVQQMLAAALLANGDVALAEEALRHALELDASNIRTRVALGRVLGLLRRQKDAVALLEDTVRMAPSEAAPREELVRAYIAANDLDSAHRAAQDLKTLQPDSASGWYLAGVVAQSQHHVEEAQADFEEALRRHDSVDALAGLARTLVMRGQSQKALDRVQAEVAANPKNAAARNLLGELHYTVKAYTQATDDFNAAIALEPTYWLSYHNLALTRLATGDRYGAVAAYQAAVKAVPREPAPAISLAELYERLGRPEDAIAQYEDVYRRNPNLSSAAGSLAMLLVTYRTDQQSLDRARDLTAAFASSEDGLLVDANGWVRFKRGEVGQALPVLERAAALAPHSKAVHYHLAMAQLKSGERDQARVNLNTALEGTATFAGVDEARTTLAGLQKAKDL